MLKVYTYAKCSTCRAATQWLRAQGIKFEERPIRERPPTEAELAEVLKANGGEIRRLFNVSGLDYRAMGLKDRVPSMTQGEAFALLRGNGNLVKRPFVVGQGVGLVGFVEDVWRAQLLT